MQTGAESSSAQRCTPGRNATPPAPRFIWTVGKDIVSTVSLLWLSAASCQAMTPSPGQGSQDPGEGESSPAQPLAGLSLRPHCACSHLALRLPVNAFTRIGFLIYTPSSLVRRRQWQPTPVLLPEKSHGLRSLVGCSPWGCEESDTTERLHFHFSLSCIGEGNGNPLQCSCLENPRGDRAWWASVHGVAESRTQLKRLSSSSFSGNHAD